MRLLIDKDNCLDIINQVQDESVVYRECSMDIGDKAGVTFGLGREMALENIKHRVENMPTIEAIPVQFIEMWMNENLTNGEDDGEVDTIFEMIRDWEQEGKEYEYKSM